MKNKKDDRLWQVRLFYSIAKKVIEKSVVAQLRQIPEVKDIQCVSGPYDILVKTEASTIEKLHEAITWKIRKIKSVRSTLYSQNKRGGNRL